MRKTKRNRYIAFILCVCMLVSCLYGLGIKVFAAEYQDIRDWVPVTEKPDYDEWGGQGASSVPNIANWKNVSYGKTVEGNYFVWGKQITWESEADAWALFAQNNDPNAVLDYLNNTYKFIAGYHQNKIWICIPVSWSLGSTEMVNGNVRYIFESDSADSFKTGSASDMGYTGPENVYNGSHTIKLYLYIEEAPKGLNGVTDWMPQATPDNTAWIAPGDEGKDISLRDSAVLDNWDTENPDTATFASWLNDAANGYTKLIVETAEGWSEEPYDVTWTYDTDQSKAMSSSAPEGYRYFVFSANTGSNVFYGAEAYGKGENIPLRFSLYFMAQAPKEPEVYAGVYGWRFVLKGTSDAVVTAYDDNNPIPLLPDILEGENPDLAAYAQTLLEKYDFQVSFDDNKTYTTYTLSNISYHTDQGNYYLIEPFDIFYWHWGNFNEWDKLKPRVRVRAASDARESYNASRWNLLGNSGADADMDKMLEMTGWDFEAQIKGRETVFAEELQERFQYLKAWVNNKYVTSLITGITYDEDRSAEYTGSIRRTAVYKVTTYDSFNNRRDFYIFFTAEADFGDLSTITVPAKDPDGIRMNLFDYWINDDPSTELGSPWDNFENWDPKYDWWDFDKGVNYNHALKFFNMSFSNEGRNLKSQLGWWNHGTETTKNVTGIVQSTLFQRYPRLNLNDSSQPDFEPFNPTGTPILHSGTDADAMTESLAYLFDPTFKHEGKSSYANVNGLFQQDSDGYYYYDSKRNFAQYDNLYNNFLLYNTWGVAPNSNSSPNGQFFPFNDAEDVFKNVSEKPDPTTGQRTLTPYPGEDGITSRSERFNHYFGFTMEIDFQQPLQGKVNAALGGDAQDMVFRFSGDDDVWIFVDGVLVLDLGGVHSGVYGEINFADGSVTTGRMDNNIREGVAMQGEKWTSTDLKTLFTTAGVGYGTEHDGYSWQGNTFVSDTLHTIKIFYLERGHYDSNLAMYFNLQARMPHKIYKIDEDGAPLSGATFAIYAAEPSNSYKRGETYHTADEFVPVNRDGSSATWETVEPLNGELVTDTDGYVSVGGIDFATRAQPPNGKKYYFLKETAPAPGYRVMPEPLVLEFLPDDSNPLRGVFRVLNQYETGAYASFSAILENGDYDDQSNAFNLYYARAELDQNGGMKISKALENEDETLINPEHKGSAMLFAVPMIYTNIGGGKQWYPIYGSNTDGFNVVDIYSMDEYYTHGDNKNGYTPDNPDGQQSAFRWALRHNLLAAALRQVSDVAAPDWYFHYDTTTDSEGNVVYSRFTAELLNLPGEKDRYLVNNEEIGINDADLRLVGLLVDAESIISLIESHGGNAAGFTSLSDEEKYILLQNTLQKQGFETSWDDCYLNGSSWDDIRSVLDKAYVENTEGTTWDRGVNLAYIDDFTRYYGSVFYIPNERRELRAMKQDPAGNPIPGAVFALYDTFADAVNDINRLAFGTTGNNGILIFSLKEDKSPANAGSGFAKMDWDGYADPDKDNTVWLKEVIPPTGFTLNESIVQIYVGQHTIYANASAYKNENGNPVWIDDPNSTEPTDGVTVLASVGKLFQSMEKFADPILNSTLLDIDGQTQFFTPERVQDDPDTATWTDSGDPSHLHFWDRRVLGYTSSDYSTAHKRSRNGTVGGESFASTENGYLRVRPTQTPGGLFNSQHMDEISTRDSRREDLTGIDLDNIFSPVNVVVIRNEYIGDADLRITKKVQGDAPTEETDSKPYTFTVTTEVEEAAGKTYTVCDADGKEIDSVTFPDQKPYTATVTITGPGTVIIRELPLGDYKVTENEEAAKINDYDFEASYNPDGGQVTVEENKVATVVVTNSYYEIDTDDPGDEMCKLIITDGGHYGEKGCGEKNETFIYKVTGTTSSGEKIELFVTVHGGESTSIVVPPGHYVVEEQHDWSWRYKNKKTVGDDSEWVISPDDWTRAERTLQASEEKEVVYYHELGDKNWLGGESHRDNHFTSPAASNGEQTDDFRGQEPALTAVDHERKRRFPKQAAQIARSDRLYEAFFL